jgi:pyroglutamyl-peptidase
MTRVLITGFEPFDSSLTNPSWEAARLVGEKPPAGLEVIARRLPCVFGDAIEALRAEVERADPELVLCVGQAGGRPDITVELVAINMDDAPIPDNAGGRPIDAPVVPGGPAAYFSGLPVKACVEAVRTAGLPASVSHTAGTFVCNHTFYGLMHLIATERPGLRGGFVHVPFAPEQVVDSGKPSLPVSVIADALRAVLTAAATVRTDIVMAGGATH